MRPAPATSRRTMLASVAAFAGMILVFAAWISVNLEEASNLRATFAARLEILEALKARPVTALAAAQTADGDHVILAPGETIAASTLQRRLIGAIEQAGARLQSIQVETAPDGAVNDLGKLSAQLSFEGTVDVLQRVLFNLETGVPYNFVEQLSVQPAAVQDAAGSRAQTLRVTLAVSAYWTRGEGT